jgi:hypothetical protein
VVAECRTTPTIGEAKGTLTNHGEPRKFSVTVLFKGPSGELIKAEETSVRSSSSLSGELGVGATGEWSLSVYGDFPEGSTCEVGPIQVKA